MSSRYFGDSNDASSTFEREYASDEGVRMVRALIEYVNQHPEKTKTSRKQVVICVEQQSNLGILQNELDALHNAKWLATWRSRIIASDFDDLNSIINKKAPRRSMASLVLLVSPSASRIKFDVPRCYNHFILVGCPATRADASCLVIDPTSRYCKIPFTEWDRREKYLGHKLRLESRACLIFGSPRTSTTHFSNDFTAEMRFEAERLRDKRTTWKERRGIVAFILGGLVGGGTMAAKLYTCTALTSKGFFLQCQGVKAGFAGMKFFEIGSFTLKTGSVKTSVAAVAELVGPPFLVGAVTGVAVGALVYFVPWDSLFDWLRSHWNGFWSWLAEMFKALCNSIASWWREDGRPKKGQSHHSRPRPRRVRGH